MENLKLVITILVFSLLFPVFGYAFTTFEDSPENYDLAISSEALMVYGITLGRGISKNVTYLGGWVEYDFNKTDMRVKWASSIEYGKEALQFQTKSIMDRYLDTWIFPNRLKVRDLKTNIWMYDLQNETILDNWDSTYNFSHFRLSNGWEIFINPPLPETDNITYAVNTLGKLTVTLGQRLFEGSAFNLRHFIGWYLGLLLGDESFGLPSFFSWLVRIMTALSVLASVVVIKELSKDLI